MIKEIQPGVFWDDEKPFYQQSQEVIKLIDDAMQTTVLNRTFETCLEGKRRVTMRQYKLTDTLVLWYIPIYNTDPMEREFMGMNDIKYLITEQE